MSLYFEGGSGFGKAVRKSMRLALWLVAATALVLLVACSTHQAVEKKKVDPEWWLGTLKDAHYRYIDAIVKACPRQGFLGNERCGKAKIVESFAAQNSAGRRCRIDDEVGELLFCVEFFTVAERIYRAAGVDPQSGMDSDDPFELLAKVTKLVEERAISKCPDVAQRDCLARELAYMVAVDPGEADRCLLTPDVGRSARCAVGLARIELYKSATLYAEKVAAVWDRNSQCRARPTLSSVAMLCPA